MLTATGVEYLKNIYISCSIKGNTSYCTQIVRCTAVYDILKVCERALRVKLTHMKESRCIEKPIQATDKLMNR